MLSKNVMSALLAATATAALLVVYNAFWQKSSTTQSATGRLSNYLKLDTAIQESANSDINVAGTDNSQAATQPSTTTPTENSTQGTEAQNTTTENSVSGQVAPAPTNVESGRGDKAETTYVVKEGDTYGCIAEKYYGSFEHYVDIMNVNPVNQRGFSERHLYVGAVLVLPAISEANLKPASSLCH